MAMGDGTTAAFGAKARSFASLFVDSRGVSWSGGGDDTIKTVETFPNLVKAYNSHLRGYAHGEGGAASEHSHLNQAVTGAKASGLMAQAVELKQRLLKDKKIDFNNDWKVLTILIGLNNLCTLCFDFTENNVDVITQQVEDVLDYIGANIPRVFVNLVPPPDITIINQLDTKLCKILHVVECPCGSSNDPNIVANVSATAQLLFDSLFALTFQPKYTQPDTFTVVGQPFFQMTQIPRLSNGQPDYSYFAPDCFHFSTKGQQAMAIALFNNINESVDKKGNAFVQGEPINCPTSATFLGTRKNSLAPPLS